MSKPKSVEIDLDAIGCGKILVDGVEIHRVRSVSIETHALEVTRVELRLVPIEGVKFRGPADVVTINECCYCGQELPVDLQIPRSDDHHESGEFKKFLPPSQPERECDD